MDPINVIGSKSRIKILHELSRKEMFVSELIEKLKLDGRNCKHHLDILEKNGIISSTFKGRRKYYSLKKEIILYISPSPKRRFELQFFEI